MARNITASDRRRLIRLASTLPVGSPERKAILAGLGKSASAPEDYDILTTEDFRTYNVFFSFGAPLGAGDMGAMRRAYDDMMLNLDELSDYVVGDARSPRKGDRALAFTVDALRPHNLNGTKWHNDQTHMRELRGVMGDFQSNSPISIRQAHFTETDESEEAHKERGAAMKRYVQGKDQGMSITLPPLDNVLLWEAGTKATGANIHQVSTAIAKYKNAHSIAKRRQAKGTLDSDYLAKVEYARRNLRKTLRGL